MSRTIASITRVLIGWSWGRSLDYHGLLHPSSMLSEGLGVFAIVEHVRQLGWIRDQIG